VTNLSNQLVSTSGGPWLNGGRGATCYDHTAVPFARSCLFPAPGVGWYTAPANSGHGTGVNVAMCDGSVHFVNANISLVTWQAIGTRNGKEIVGGNEF
jgi:prepilin-type processing-associated H-X9-DG protein